MKPFDDPRLSVYADPAPNFGEIIGMPYGIEAAGDIPNAEVSFPGFPAVRGQNAPIPIYSLAQVEFMKAEAAVRGWISDDPTEHYSAGIKASMNQWGVGNQEDIDQFLSNPEIIFKPEKGLEQILTQKWIAMYTQGLESWADWRRTGLPVLSPAPEPLNGDDIPSRYGYPTSERDLNSQNYDEALGLLGGEDNLNTKLWWDKN